MHMKQMATFIVAAAMALTVPARAESAAPAAIVPLAPYLVKLAVVHATVGGHEGTFLFDTGEGVSSITPQFAAQIGCRPWRQITGFQMGGNRAGDRIVLPEAVCTQ